MAPQGLAAHGGRGAGQAAHRPTSLHLGAAPGGPTAPRLGGPVAATAFDKVTGPYDFVWLLQRVADFHEEAPPWLQRGQRLPSEFRSEPPPPPLQLLVPESLSFEPPGKNRIEASALYFSDRGGFLRGTRRSARQGPQLCQALLRLMRHRQVALTLTHSAGTLFEPHTLVTGAKAWSDRSFQYVGIPDELLGATFFAGPHESVPTGELLLSSPVQGFTYVWSQDASEADGGIPSIGWDRVAGTMSFGSGRTVRIYRKLLTAGAAHVIPMNYKWIGGVAFQPAEQPELELSAAPASLVSVARPLTAQPLAGAGGPYSGRSALGCSGESAAPASSPAPVPRSASSEQSSQARRRGRSVLLKSSGPESRSNGPAGGHQAAGTWKMSFHDGTTQQLTDEEVAAHFGFIGEGRARPWPVGAKLLQSRFFEHQRPDNACLVYEYDALKQEANATHDAVQANIVNHFERYGFLTHVADHASISAAPILISQHLSYHCNLELLSGEFEFMRDARGQLWLTDVRKLLFVPAARDLAGSSTSGATAADNGDPQSQKLQRYFSEEALRNLKLSEETGGKFQHMLAMMRQHYHEVRDATGVDELLRQTHETMETTIPMFEGTDLKAFARTFGQNVKRLQGRDDEDGGAAAGGLRQKSGAQRRQPVAPKSQCIVGKGRLGALARPLSSAPSVSSRRQRRTPSAAAGAAQPLSGPSGEPAWGAWTASLQRAPSTLLVAPTQQGTSRVVPRSSVSAARTPRTPRARGVAAAGLLAAGDSAAGGAEEEGSGGFEIVLPDSAQRLLPGSGPGLRPDGPTFDLVGPLSARADGAGLQGRRAARTLVRLVEVPAVGKAMAGGHGK